MNFMNYLDHKKLRAFEDKIGYKKLIENNVLIGKTLGFEPEIEYAICSDGSCCYSPINVSSMYSDWRSQKAECERWLEDNKKSFPDSWVIKGNYKPTKLEHYPAFHLDWNDLIEAIKRLSKQGYSISINPDSIFNTWQDVYDVCNNNKAI